MTCVNCYGRTHSTCTDPDGLMSRITGGDERRWGCLNCPIPDSLHTAPGPGHPDSRLQGRARHYGEVGFAPEWTTNSCTRECEEKVSAFAMHARTSNDSPTFPCMRGGVISLRRGRRQRESAFTPSGRTSRTWIRDTRWITACPEGKRFHADHALRAACVRTYPL